jgi:hypothetical protein
VPLVCTSLCPLRPQGNQEGGVTHALFHASQDCIFWILGRGSKSNLLQPQQWSHVSVRVGPQVGL